LKNENAERAISSERNRRPRPKKLRPRKLRLKASQVIRFTIQSRPLGRLSCFDPKVVLYREQVFDDLTKQNLFTAPVIVCKCSE
jgi:hypothetical protein